MPTAAARAAAGAVAGALVGWLGGTIFTGILRLAQFFLIVALAAGAWAWLTGRG